jgi:hypothetical protein
MGSQVANFPVGWLCFAFIREKEASVKNYNAVMLMTKNFPWLLEPESYTQVYRIVSEGRIALDVATCCR